MNNSTNPNKKFRTVLIDGYSVNDDENHNMIIFESWRDKVIDNTNKQCLIVQDDEMQHINTIFEIRKVPACLVQMTKMMCQCNAECTAASLFPLKFDTSCVIYNFDNLFLSLEYHNCDTLRRWIVDGKLRKSKSKITSLIFADIFTRFDNLCANVPNSFENLQCIMYTFIESCKESNICSKFKISNFFQFGCENEDYLDQIDVIMNSLGSYAYDFTVRDFNREARSILDRQKTGNMTFEIESFSEKSAITNNSITLSGFRNMHYPIILLLVLSAGCFGYNYQIHSELNNKKVVKWGFLVLCLLYLCIMISNNTLHTLCR